MLASETRQIWPEETKRESTTPPIPRGQMSAGSTERFPDGYDSFYFLVVLMHVSNTILSSNLGEDLFLLRQDDNPSSHCGAVRELVHHIGHKMALQSWSGYAGTCGCSAGVVKLRFFRTPCQCLHIHENT